jgi:hypothetical protein
MYESELDIDDIAVKEIEERTIDDFEDVDEKDKRIFKMWNYFIREHKRSQNKENMKSGNIIVFKKPKYKDLL